MNDTFGAIDTSLDRIAWIEAENARLTAMVANAQHALDEVGAGIARRVLEEREACAQIADRIYPDNAAEAIRARLAL